MALLNVGGVGSSAGLGSASCIFVVVQMMLMSTVVKEGCLNYRPVACVQIPCKVLKCNLLLLSRKIKLNYFFQKMKL